jgi:hypothetical protein
LLDGIGTQLGNGARFTVGIAGLGADLILPEAFHRAEDCAVPLVRDAGRLWFIDPVIHRAVDVVPTPHVRLAIDAGDRLVLRCADETAEILFAHIPATGGGRLGA